MLWEALEQRMLLASTLSVGNETFNLATGVVGFQVTRTGDLTPVVDVGYSITAGTAIPGTNYTSTAPTGVLHFDSGQTSATIPLTILSNNFAETSRDFTIDLTGVIDTFGPTPTFADQQTFGTSFRPKSVTVADLNGDGKPDLIVSNYSGSSVSVLLNTTAPGATTPSFAPQQTFATGGASESVSVSDLNGDGKPDIVLVNYNNPGTVSVLVNTTPTGATTASFAAEQTIGGFEYPIAVLEEDINGDGLPDLIVGNYRAGTFPNYYGRVAVLLNTTAPGATSVSFADPQTFATDSSIRSIAEADVNGDGRPDLVVANGGNNEVSVLLNTTAPGSTTASFSAPTTFATGSYAESVTAADINGDGRPDVIVAN